jgi:hypothetical protein
MNHCNLRCHYCYVGQEYGYDQLPEVNLGRSLDDMRDCLSKARLDCCLFNLCAYGETLLFEALPELVEMILQLGHYVSIVTNNTLTKQLEKLLELPDNLRYRLFFKCSFHYLELKKRGLLGVFADNVAKIKSSATAFTVELTANDESIPLIPEIKEFCLANFGALCHIIESRDQTDRVYERLTKLPLERHVAAWGSFNSPLFDYQQKNWGQRVNNFCYAGEYRISLNICDGEVWQCDGMLSLENMYNYVNDGIKAYPWRAVGNNCALEHCYISYVHSSLYDLWGENLTAVPTYAEERDRISEDGSHWLTVRFQDVFSHRMSEFREPYSKAKAFYIELFMRKVYKGVDPTDEERAKLAGIVAASLTARGIRSVAVLGIEQYGKWLSDILSGSGIKLRFFIKPEPLVDTAPPTLKIKLWRQLKYLLRNALFVFDAWPKVDAVIVAPYVEHRKYAEAIGGKCGNILSILGIVE